MLSRLFLSLIACYTLFATEEINVFLGSENPLLPVYIAAITHEKSSLSSEYMNKLNAILIFDMDHSGMTTVLSGRAHEAVGADMSLASLRRHGVACGIRCRISNSSLECTLVQASSSSTRTIGPLRLVGDFAADRTTMHHLANTIHELLFGKPGIAHTHIVYTVKRRIQAGVYASDLVCADYDGGNIHTVMSSKTLLVTPLWIPCRSQSVTGKTAQRSADLVYISYALGQPKLFGCNLKDGKTYRISLMKGNQLTPALSRDGSYIAFCSDISGTSDLYIARFEAGVGIVGTPRRLFHAKGTVTASPSFSPQGTKLAFVSNKDGAPRIYVMDYMAADGAPKLITKKCRENTAPAWSPDGTKIAYSARNQGDRQIWIYDMQKGLERQLTDGPGVKESPSWAPDSSHIVFHAYQGTGCELFITNIRHPSLVKITSGLGEKQFASWEP